MGDNFAFKMANLNKFCYALWTHISKNLYSQTVSLVRHYKFVIANPCFKKVGTFLYVGLFVDNTPHFTWLFVFDHAFQVFAPLKQSKHLMYTHCKTKEP